MDCSTPGFPVHHKLWSLLKLVSIESVTPSNHLILCHPFLLLPLIFSSESFLVSQFFVSGGQSIGKDPNAGQEGKGMTEDEIVVWHHQLNGHESEQAPGVRHNQVTELN